ncbi:MAG: prolyl oligopeptidase family serine peptidase [Treponema sp.]|jgi:predicted peptidase|nr:prolyl oligopeptidase family serine peptidase [Treponema sp.]
MKNKNKPVFFGFAALIICVSISFFFCVNSPIAAVSNETISLADRLSSIVDENVVIKEDSPEIQKRFLAFKYIPPGKSTAIPYRLYLPDSYGERGAKFPLLLFLNGLGERGTDNQIQISVNTPFELLVLNEKISRELPCIIAAPQCPESPNYTWSHPAVMSDLVALVDTLTKNLNVDLNRVYVTGLSMGGNGTFEILAQRPGLFAAGMPIGGGPDSGTQIAVKIKDIPIWVFHAANDRAVPVQKSREIVKAIESLNGKFIKYTEFITGVHGIWFGIYSDVEKLKWLFDQRK